MLNQVVMVGRLAQEPTVKETENGAKVTNITLAVPRSYKNAEGVYETDFVDCTLWNAVAENTCEYCKKGDIIGVKGRVEANNYEKENGEKVYSQRIVAEKVTFLSSNKDKQKDDDMEM